MSVYTVDPIADRRWEVFLDGQASTAFHSAGWLEALRRTYSYEPIVLTTSAPGTPLTNGVAFCRIKSWTGSRLVSLPFSDHCDPLVAGPDDRREIVTYLKDGVKAGRWKYVEFRPRLPMLSEETAGAVEAAQQFCLHTLELTQTLDQLYRGFHPSCVRRPIQRAERERLKYERGNDASLVETFYRLMRLTRRRHGAPPQPLAWFSNLAACLGEQLTIRIASKDGQPVAGLLTMRAHRTMVYKYGGSDAAYHKLGGVPFLFWKAIQEGKEQGVEQLDLGRSDLDQPGLLLFKDRLGATRTPLTYYRHSRTKLRDVRNADWKRRAAGWLCERLPDPALTVAGRVLYKHLG